MKESDIEEYKMHLKKNIMAMVKLGDQPDDLHTMELLDTHLVVYYTLCSHSKFAFYMLHRS